MQPELLAKREHLAEILRRRTPLLIAYSGGVDSACLLAEAARVLGPERILGVIADSPSLPRQALADAVALAKRIEAPLEVVRTEELQDPRYASNPVNRCYFCKAELFSKLEELAAKRGFQAIAYGENADDMRQVRPGREAATQFSIIAPLRDASLTKAEVRALSRDLDLPTSEAPAQPCLSSRIPHGTPVTTAALGMVEQAEAFVRALGFQVLRVRHFVSAGGGRPRALVQVAPAEMVRLRRVENEIRTGLLQAGYAAVEVDPAGYQA